MPLYKDIILETLQGSKPCMVFNDLCDKDLRLFLYLVLLSPLQDRALKKEWISQCSVLNTV